MNHKLDLKLFENIMNIPSPTGYTHKVIDYIQVYAKELGYESYQNKKGNLIIDVKGKSDYTIGFSAHVDTLGLMVRSIRGDGSLSFTTLGGPILATYDGEYCTIHTRSGKTYSGTILSTSPSFCAVLIIFLSPICFAICTGTVFNDFSRAIAIDTGPIYFSSWFRGAQSAIAVILSSNISVGLSPYSIAAR